MLKVVTLLLRFGLFRGGIREFRGDPLLPLVDGAKDWFVQEAFHEPHQDKEVERLCADSEPID
jgi:hypothetical protein